MGENLEGEGGKMPLGEGEPGGSISSLEEPKQKRLTFQEASECLNMLGKDETGMRYAYLALTAVNRKLTDVSVILDFKHVFFVDVSENLLTFENLQVLSDMPFLVSLKAEQNRITSAALRPMRFLQVLKLGKNQILDTVGINQPTLNILELNHNQIFFVQLEDQDAPALNRLDLRGNFLPKLEGSFPVSLEMLYLADNRIAKICSATIRKLTNLRELHLRDNHIRKLDGFTSDLENLKYLNLRGNKIAKFRQFRKLQCLKGLETIVVLENPIAGELPEKNEEEEAVEEEEKEDVTRLPILVFLPWLKRINKGFVNSDEKNEVQETRQEKLDEIMAEDSSDDEDLVSAGASVNSLTE